jgi:lipopolysaccharide export system permease protein
MSILSRYLIKQHTIPFLFAFSALTGFLLINQVARRIESLLGKGLPWTVIAEFFALTLPYLVAMTVSMAVLVSVLYAFSRMADDNEVTAIRASGVSLFQMLLPVLACATLIAGLAFLFTDQVLPRTNHRLRTLMTSIARASPTFSLKEHAINQVGQRRRYFLRAASIDQSTYRMRDVALYDLSDSRSSRVVYADSGRLGYTPGQQDLQLRLYEAKIHEFDREDTQMFQVSDVDEQILIIRGIGADFVRAEQDNYRGDREMGTCQLDSVVREAEHDRRMAEVRAHTARRNSLRFLVGLPALEPDTSFTIAVPSLYCRVAQRLAGLITPTPLEAQEADPLLQREGIQAVDSTVRTLLRMNAPARRVLTAGALPPNLGEFRALDDRANAARIRAANYKVEYHKKYAIPAACIVFVLIGIPIALRFPSGGVGLVVGASMIVFFFYYIGLIAGEDLANRLVIPPFWALWMSHVIFSVAGILALWRTHRRGTARTKRA